MARAILRICSVHRFGLSPPRAERFPQPPTVMRIVTLKLKRYPDAVAALVSPAKSTVNDIHALQLVGWVALQHVDDLGHRSIENVD
jgi:hypothetical protein